VNGAKPDPRNAALKYLWARERIKFLDDYRGAGEDPAKVAEVTKLGLDYNLLTAYTSFIAIEEVPVNDDPNGLRTVKQALPLPQGVSDLAVGFDLGIEGLSGLPMPGKTAGWALIFGLVLLLLLGLCGFIWFGRRRLTTVRNLLFVLGLAAGLSACGHSPTRSGGDSVTFLLGEDRSSRNPYFKLAADYFRTNHLEKTDREISGCRSLLDVRDFLANNRPASGPWHRINFVVHGNQWTGMNFPVSPGVPRATTKSLYQAAFLGLPASAIDSSTQIVVHGCNLGRDTALLVGLSWAFGHASGVFPVVISARYFNLFDQPSEQPAPLKRFLADSRFVIFPSSQFPGNSLIAKQLAEKYPDDTTNWRKALSRLKPDQPGASYVHYFTIPVKWTAIYPDSTNRPTLDNLPEQYRWIAMQTELSAQLTDIGIAAQQFNWTFTKTDYETTDGQKLPALTAEGRATIYCILQPLKEVKNGQVLLMQPEVADRRFYTVVQGG